MNGAPNLVLVASFPTPPVAMAYPEFETYLGLLIMATFWAIFSGSVVVIIEREGEASHREALGWVASFAAASLVSAFCFRALL